MRQLNIAFVVCEDIFNHEGTTIRVLRILQLLDNKNCIKVIATSNKDHSSIKGNEDVQVIRLGSWLLSYKWLPYPLKLVPLLMWNMLVAIALLKDKFDIVYCANDFVSFPSVYLISKIRKCKVIFEAHSIFSEDLREAGHSGMLLKLEQCIEKFVIKHSDYVIALSGNTLEFYNKYNIKSALIPVFFDTELYQSSHVLKNKYFKLIGLIGPFDVEKRGKLYLEFLYSHLDFFDERIHFVVIGRYNKIVMHERITYVGYLDSLLDYIDQLSQLDAVLVPEKISSFGPLNKVLEPIACNVPVFATPKALNGLFGLQPGRDLFVFEENILVKKINELIFDEKEMNGVVQRGRAAVELYYGKGSNKEKLFNILHSLMEK